MDISREKMKQQSTISSQQGEGEVYGSADPLANEINPSSKERNQRSKLPDADQNYADMWLGEEPELMDTHLQFTLIVERRLMERRQIRETNRSQRRDSSHTCIYKFPPQLEFGGTTAQQPEIVSIGPYHRGKDHLLEFEHHKWTYLDRFLSRSKTPNYMDVEGTLSDHMKMMMALEERARNCYQHESNMSSQDFVEMMLVDGCFIIVLLLLLGGNGDGHGNDDNFIFSRPWMIPVLNQDLLKMENQLPFFVLDYLFQFCGNSIPYLIGRHTTLPSLALEVFGLSFPMPLDTQRVLHEPLHLLELVYLSLLPSKRGDLDDEHYHPSNQSIQSVTRLRSSGIKFKPTYKTVSFLEIKASKKPTSFLDIKYKRQVLEIPTITINDYTTCLLRNFVAWEQSHRFQFRTFSYITDYVAFMNFLISEPRDVAFLCADGIISRLSQDDASVASWFNNCRKATVFNNRSSYLSEELGILEAYYSSHWATVPHTYFSSPWSSISVFTAFLLIVCSLIQSIMSIVSYKAHPK